MVTVKFVGLTTVCTSEKFKMKYHMDSVLKFLLVEHGTKDCLHKVRRVQKELSIFTMAIFTREKCLKVHFTVRVV